MNHGFSRIAKWLVAVSSVAFSLGVRAALPQVPVPAQATTQRTILGNAANIPLAQSQDAETVRTIGVLRKQAATAGSVRVIVGMRVAFAAEGVLDQSTAQLQRKDIAAMQTLVLDRLPTFQQGTKSAKRFEFIPFMALEATSVELDKLLSFSEVTSMEEDKAVPAHLAESVPLIGGTTAWASGYTGAGQVVAILDTGVDKNHPFLSGKVVSEGCFSSNNSTDGATSLCPGYATSSTAANSALPYGTGVCPSGKCDHGTHVAGIAVGSGASFSGVAKDASIIAVQVFSRFINTTYCVTSSSCALTYKSDQLLGLQHVYSLRSTYNIAAVNMSLGGGSYSSQSTCASANVSAKAAIDNLRSVNIATVISSGNDGYVGSMGAPGCISTAVSVGATWDMYYASGYNCTNKAAPSNYWDYGGVDKVACFSNSASFLNLLAPGVWINSSVPYGLYQNYPGTSMAAPHVAGAWALLKQKKPAITVTEALTALSSTGTSVTDTRNGVTKPRINVN